MIISPKVSVGKQRLILLNENENEMVYAYFDSQAQHVTSSMHKSYVYTSNKLKMQIFTANSQRFHMMFSLVSIGNCRW